VAAGGPAQRERSTDGSNRRLLRRVSSLPHWPLRDDDVHLPGLLLVKECQPHGRADLQRAERLRERFLIGDGAAVDLGDDVSADQKGFAPDDQVEAAAAHVQALRRASVVDDLD
jgi:hypothetical protein